MKNFVLGFNEVAPTICFFAIIISTFFLYTKFKQGNSLHASDNLYSKIKRDIQFAISPKYIEMSDSVKELVELAVEVWRIDQRITKLSSELDENKTKAINASLKKIKKYLKRYDIEIIDYTGQKYNNGLNLDVLSIEKDNSIIEPTVKETIEPTIMHKGQILKKAKIILINNCDNE
jgi:hypothetical protein